MKRFVITWINEWRQFDRKLNWNWYTFTPIQLDFEYDKMTKGICFEIIILGLGFFLRFNLPASDAIFKKWEEEAEKDYKKSLKIKGAKKKVTKKKVTKKKGKG